MTSDDIKDDWRCSGCVESCQRLLTIVQVAKAGDQQFLCCGQWSDFECYMLQLPQQTAGAGEKSAEVIAGNVFDDSSTSVK